MSLVNQQTFTIGQLARIALGTGNLTHQRLYILQNIFLFLLRKLNCDNEKVKIKGLAAKYLQKLLNDYPQSCQLHFLFENLPGFQEKYHLLGELERKLQEIDTKMQQHFELIRSRNRTTIFAANYWRTYASPTEDLGALCLKENRKYWFLLESAVFNTEIRRQIVPPIVDKLKKFEHRIETMQKQLWKITQMGDETTEKLKSVGYIIRDIEELRSSINIGEKEFREAIAEVDEMLSCKLHRVIVPALKIYLEKRLDDANRHLKVLHLEGDKCPPTKPLLIADKKTCLSCGRQRNLNVLKKFKNLKSVDENIKCTCCISLTEPSIIERIDRMKNADMTDRRRSREIEQISRCSDSDCKNSNTLESSRKKPENRNTCLSEEAGRKNQRVPAYGPPV